MKNVVLTISYDGTDFSGFQRQSGERTVQGVLEESLSLLEGEVPIVYGAGRTDSGVHALGQVVNFYSKRDLPESAYLKGLNNILPDDLKVKQMKVADDNFHARKSAKAKEYHYWLRLAQTPSPVGLKTLWISEPLAVEAMGEALEHFRGSHDFSGFRTTGSSVVSTTRTIFNTSYKRLGNLVVFSMIANGFLYNMVRIIMGTLLDVGRGKIAPDEIPLIIESKDRQKAGATAPACGLYLYKVYYEHDVFCVEKNNQLDRKQIKTEQFTSNLDIKDYIT